MSASRPHHPVTLSLTPPHLKVGCRALLSLESCGNASLTSLDLSLFQALAECSCSWNNSLQSMNVAGCSAVKQVSCHGQTALTSMDVSGCVLLFMYRQGKRAQLGVRLQPECPSLVVTYDGPALVVYIPLALSLGNNMLRLSEGSFASTLMLIALCTCKSVG